MEEVDSQRSGNAVNWVRVVGWQVVALVLALLIGISALWLSSAVAQETQARADIIEDAAKVTGFVSDCLPVESKHELRKLIQEATDMLIQEGRQELDRTENY